MGENGEVPLYRDEAVVLRTHTLGEADRIITLLTRQHGRVRGLIIEMPVLDNAVEAGLVVFGPMMLCARYLPFTVRALRAVTRPIPRGLVPFWAGIVLDTLDQQPAAMAATLHGIIFGRIAPPTRVRRTIGVPALVVGHPKDPIHPAADAAMLAEEIPGARFVRARSILEWRVAPDRLNAAAAEFALECWETQAGDSRFGC